jgi:hypothetical protein
MSRQFETNIRRRSDGSIDTDFYVCRAAFLRSVAQKDEPIRWVRSLGRLVSKLVRARPRGRSCAAGSFGSNPAR